MTSFAVFIISPSVEGGRDGSPGCQRKAPVLGSSPLLREWAALLLLEGRSLWLNLIVLGPGVDPEDTGLVLLEKVL